MTLWAFNLLDIRDAQITWCVCGSRVFKGNACTICPLIAAETVRVAS